MLAASSGGVTQGAILLLAYSLGLGVPFLIVAWLFGSIKPLLGWLSRHSVIINRVAGVLLVIIGLLILTGQLTVIAAVADRGAPELQRVAPGSGAFCAPR